MISWVIGRTEWARQMMDGLIAVVKVQKQAAAVEAQYYTFLHAVLTVDSFQELQNEAKRQLNVLEEELRNLEAS